MDYKKYAKIIFDAFLEKDEKDFNEFFQKFIALLKKKKKIKILPRIFKEVKHLFELHKKKDKTEIVLKNKEEFEKYREKFEKFSDKFNFDDYKIIENKNIVGGYILKNAKYILDNSYKKRLLKLYQRLIK